MGDIYYLGVPSGNGSRGSLVFPDAGKSFHAGSGSTSAYRAPDGTYDIGKREWGEQDVSLGKAKYKYRITGVTKNGTKAAPGHAWDPNKGKHGEMRSKLLIHPDGGKAPGTSGCIGVRGTPTAWGNANPADNSADVAAAQEVDQLLGSGKYDRVIVKTFKNVEEMEAFQKQIAPDAPMKRPDEKKPDPPPAPPKKKGSGGKGKPSKTNKSAELLQGERTVFAGSNKLQVAYAGPDCTHTGGGCVVEGSKTVFVGEKKYPMARVQDATNDGHKIATGENTVETA
ncbi:MAG TPA: hypothetical protein PKA58_32020 [Polyangium sp.]|nr:hypothetical protein [Polyangium sp.]